MARFTISVDDRFVSVLAWIAAFRASTPAALLQAHVDTLVTGWAEKYRLALGQRAATEMQNLMTSLTSARLEAIIAGTAEPAPTAAERTAIFTALKRARGEEAPPPPTEP